MASHVYFLEGGIVLQKENEKGRTQNSSSENVRKFSKYCSLERQERTCSTYFDRYI